ncbi:MAG: hypothetical protein AAFN50_08775 [Pseudomonadota bacterium]
MECFLQYLDDLDDLYGMVGLLAERLRRIALSFIGLAVLIATPAMGGWLAFTHPPIGLAVSYLLSITLMYRLVTAPPPPRSA